MGKWVQKHKNTGYHVDAIALKEQDAERQEVERQKRDRQRAQEDAEHSDELLAEIDSVLEENAEEFVAAYQQKGGQ